MGRATIDDKVVNSVINDLINRSRIGKIKYNTTLDRTDLSLLQWLQHAYEEGLDQVNYLKKSIILIKDLENNKTIEQSK